MSDGLHPLKGRPNEEIKKYDGLVIVLQRNRNLKEKGSQAKEVEKEISELLEKADKSSSLKKRLEEECDAFVALNSTEK